MIACGQHGGSHARALVLLMVSVVVSSAACAGPTWSSGDYRKMLANTAEALASDAQTVLLAGRLAVENRAFQRFAADVISQAEDDASSAQQTFDSRQPVSEADDELRSKADETIQDVTSDITDARVAIRTGHADKLRPVLKSLAEKLDDLQKLQQVDT